MIRQALATIAIAYGIISGIFTPKLLANELKPNSWAVLTRAVPIVTYGLQVKHQLEIGDLVYIDDIADGHLKLRNCMYQYDWFCTFWLDADSVVPLDRATEYISLRIAADPKVVKPDGFELLVALCKGRFDQVISSLEGELTRRGHIPRQHYYYLLRSVAWSGKGEYENSLADCDTILSFAPECGAAHYLKGESLRNLNRFPEALKSSEQAIKHGFDHPAVYGLQAELLTGHLRDYASAIRLLDQRIALLPTDGDAYGFRAQVYSLLFDCHHSFNDINQAIRLQPCDASYRSQRSRLFVVLGDADAAFVDAKTACAIQPHANSTWEQMIRFAPLERWPELLATLSASIEQFPDDVDLHLFRGYAFMLSGDFKAALADYNKAIALGAKDAATLETRAAIRGALGDFSGADGDLVVAVRHSPVRVSSADWYRIVATAVPNYPYPALDRTKVLAQYSIPMQAGFIAMPVEINGMLLRFVLDTACSNTIIDQCHRQVLGPSIGDAVVTTLMGRERATLYEPTQMRVAGKWIQVNSPMLSKDLGDLTNEAHISIDGILGMDVLQHFVLHINRDLGKLTILTEPPKDAGAMIDLTPSLADSQNTTGAKAVVPNVLVRLPNDETLQAHVDTGNIGASVLLNPDTFAKLSKEKRIEPLGTFSQILFNGKKSQQKRGIISDLIVARFAHGNLVVGEQVTGNSIGLNYLARYIVTFDFPRHVMYLKPGKYFSSSEGELIMRQGFSLFTE